MKKIVRWGYERLLLDTDSDQRLFRCKTPRAERHDCMELYLHDIQGGDRFMCYLFKPYEVLGDLTGIEVLNITQAEVFLEEHYGQLSKEEEAAALELELLDLSNLR